MGQIFGYLVSKTYPRLYLNRSWNGSLILLNLFLEKFSKYFDTWDWDLIGEANLFTPLVKPQGSLILGMKDEIKQGQREACPKGHQLEVGDRRPPKTSS